jgi:uracil phosphoribosyltransferase
MATGHDAFAPMSGRSQPERHTVSSNPRLVIIHHNLGLSLLSHLRDAQTTTSAFDQFAGELAHLVLWEACRELPLIQRNVMNHSGQQIQAHQLAERIAGVVILRAGLLFAPAFRRQMGDAPVYQVGARRNEATLEPDIYVNNLPEDRNWADRVLVLDPMLATGGSARAAVRLIREGHDGPIDVVTLISAPLGVDTVLAADENCRVFTLALDDRLDDRGFIEPGLGDAGDRLFGTA